ncbi:MAG: sctG [Chlamydiales bacterium]|nr:sctG [Chlamydiales bacterium]
MDIDQEFLDDLPLFIESGFIAIKQMDEVSARRIFEAAQGMSPGHPAVKVGFGYIHLNKLELKEAALIFSEVLAEDPDHDLAHMFLGISHLLNQEHRAKGEQIIRQVMQKSEDASIVNLGQTTLDWAAKELKTSKPFFAQHS